METTGIIGIMVKKMETAGTIGAMYGLYRGYVVIY